VQTQKGEAAATRVSLRISNHDGEFVFRPRSAILRVGDKQAAPVAACEFGMWDRWGKPVSSGGTWGYRPIAGEYALNEREKTYLLVMDFPLAIPPPESDAISLELFTALEAPGHAVIPRIRFLPVRWSEGYS